MRATAIAAATMLFSITAAAAGEAPALPAGATKLDAAGIAKLYQGSRATFNNYTNKESLTGEIWYDLKGGKMWGSYLWDGKDHGVFTGKIKAKGDQYCYKADTDKKFICADVYRDGDTYYETDTKGNVMSMDMLMPSGVPEVPASAKPVTPDELLAAADGKQVFVTIYDFGKPLVAMVKWSAKKKKVTGNFVMDGAKKGKVDGKFTVKDSAICHSAADGACYTYFLDGAGFYEKTKDGKVHAWSRFL